MTVPPTSLLSQKEFHESNQATGNLTPSGAPCPIVALCLVKINYRFWWPPAFPPNEESLINACLMVSSTDEQSQSTLCGL